jgi:hypothetical protein
MGRRRATLLWGSKDYFQSLQDSALRILCPKMTLARQDSSELHSYSGPGLIRQDERGRLEFLLFEVGKPVSEDACYSNVKVGELIPKSQYYTLSGEDMQGTVWTACDLSPSVSLDSHRSHGVFKGDMPRIQGESHHLQTSASDAVLGTDMLFDSDCDLPLTHATSVSVETGDGFPLRSWSRDRAKLSIGQFKFDIHQNDSMLFVSVWNNHGVDAEVVESLVQQALQFVTARTLSPRVTERHSDSRRRIILSGPGPDHGKPRLPPPVRANLSLIEDAGQSFWSLFRSYYTFCSSSPSSKWHELSCSLARVIEDSGASAVTHAAGLSIGIEQVLAILYPGHGLPSEDIKRDIEAVGEAIERMDISDRLKSRVRGSLAMFTQPRAIDKLRQLAGEAVITQRHAKAWQALRNAAAHGQTPEKPECFPELLQHINCATMLLYLLVFKAIGYDGPYCDYSKPGWPACRGRPKAL